MAGELARVAQPEMMYPYGTIQIRSLISGYRRDRALPQARFCGPFDFWLRSPPFQGGQSGFESPTVCRKFAAICKATCDPVKVRLPGNRSGKNCTARTAGSLAAEKVGAKTRL